MPKPLITATASQNLASAALSSTITFTADFVELLEVNLHSTIAITQTVTCTRVSVNGANYSFVLDTSSLSSQSNYIYAPTRGKAFRKGDTLTVTCTNTSTPAATVYLEVIYREDI